MATTDEAQAALVDAIAKATKELSSKQATPLTTTALLQLSEALAWIISPAQPHSGGSASD